jgi:UDP-galactopyranose mutase
MSRNDAVIVFSHLRWGFVYQRPQHILSRIAKTRRVFFVEEPIVDESSWLEVETPVSNVWVLRPHSSLPAGGFHASQLPAVVSLISAFLRTQFIEDCWYWLYTPMALPIVDRLEWPPSHIVYDCMDELSAFLNAPPELPSLEKRLFQQASVVFTGGRSLFHAKRRLHSNVYCFPSSVDVDHFSAPAQGDPKDQASIGRPRFGYSGVIDERIDLDLLAAFAEARPHWQLVMLGPVVKIDPKTLPQQPNIHYLGQKSYFELPGFIQSWDVCLLPFARNEATRYISPTKTLEYMAAGKLIASTRVTDVATTYGDILYFGDTPDEWVDACQRALQSAGGEREHRLRASASVVSGTSWDLTVAHMVTILTTGQRRTARPSASRLRSDMNLDVAIIGAGPTGLSAAYHLGERATLIERNATVGGWCRSITDGGFTFDYAGHIMFSNEPYVHQLYQLLLGDNVHWQNREAWVFSKNVYTRYPFQSSLYGLPPDVIEECLIGAIEARFGPLASANGNGSSCKTNGKQHLPFGDLKDSSADDCCGDGTYDPSASIASAANAVPQSFQDFIYKVWGAGIAKHFAIPYNRKLWGVPPSTMETSWLGGRVPLPDLRQIIRGALNPSPAEAGPNARFGYPLRGGFQALMDGFLPLLKGPVLLERTVRSIDPFARRLTLSDGSTARFERLISTMPLPELIRALEPAVPGEILQEAAALRHVSVRCVNLGVGRENLTDKHWIYYPEDTIFHRIFVQGNASPHCNAPGGFGLCCEISYSAEKPLPVDGAELIQRCIDDCRRVGLLGAEDPILTANQLDLPYAYVIYDHSRRSAVQAIRRWLERFGILLAGRYSEWEYYNSDHAFMAGKRVADAIKQASTVQAEFALAKVSATPGANGQLAPTPEVEEISHEKDSDFRSVLSRRCRSSDLASACPKQSGSSIFTTGHGRPVST